MSDLPVIALGQQGSATIFATLLARMSSHALLDAADALRAWGAETDSEDIEAWVVRRPRVQQ